MYSGVASLEAVGVEATIVDVEEIEQPFMLFGLLDLSGLKDTDEIELRLYARVYNGTRQLMASARYRGVLPEPVVYVRPLLMPPASMPRLAAVLLEGGPVTIPYRIAVWRPDIGVARLLMRQIA